jgi:Rrf2 family protein
LRLSDCGLRIESPSLTRRVDAEGDTPLPSLARRVGVRAIRNAFLKSAIRNPQSEITMRVSAKAEYACIALLDLAAKHRGGQPTPVKYIADQHSVPLPFLMQILMQLKGARLVVSARGSSGGYQLARKPEAITLADIISAIDGPLTPASDEEGSSTLRALRGIWRDIVAEEQRLLENITLADLARRTQQGGVLSYQI